MKQIEQTRREFLRSAGKGLLGAAALTAVPAVLQPALAEGCDAPAYPLTWQKLDKDVVQKHAYEAFFSNGGCCAAVFSGIMEVMADDYGYPYNQFPGKMFANGAGGYGAQTLCGSLGGACAVIGLFCEPKDAGALRNELYAWYKVQAFPHYQPEFESITTVADSILCADSVGKYMKATGLEMGDDKRKARCAGLSADTAVKVVELLNIHFGFEAAPVVEEAPAEEKLADNEYIGVATSEIGGEIKVKVTMDGDKIAKIEVLSHNETVGIADPAFEKIPQAIIEANSTEVDVVSQATKTSEALIAAVNNALAQIK